MMRTRGYGAWFGVAAILAGLVAVASAEMAAAADDSPAGQAAVDAAIEALAWDEALRLGRAELERLEQPGSRDGDATAGDDAQPVREAAILELRSSLMFCEFQLGNLAAARSLQESVVELRARVAPDSLVQRADDWNDLAMICDRLRDDAGAADAWTESVALLTSTGEATAAAKLVPRLSALAEAERRLGHHESAEAKLREAIAISERHRPRDFRHARLVNNLGALCWDQHRYDEATRLLHEALRITEEDPEATPLRVAIAQHNLANLAREQGDVDESERRHLATLAVARKSLTGDPQFPVFLKELAVLYADEERTDEAFALWDEALAHLAASPDSTLASEVHYERGRAELALDRLDAADASLRTCLAMRESALDSQHPRIGQVVAARGVLELARERPKDARVHFERASRILDGTAVYPEERLEAHEGLARLDWRDGRKREAIDGLRRTLALADELRLHRTSSETSRADWVERQVARADRLIGWLVSLERTDEALAASEGVRGRILLDQMAAAHVDWRRGIPNEQRASFEARERTALAEIRARRRDLERALAGSGAGAADSDATTSERALDGAIATYRNLLEEARAASPAFAGSLRETSPDGAVDAVRGRLAPGEIALVYHVGEAQSFLFEIAAGAPTRCTPLAAAGRPLGERELGALLAAGETHLGRAERLRGVGTSRPARERASPAGQLEALGRALLPDSVRSRVLATHRAYVIPDGALHGFPFDALVLATANGRATYWLDEGPEICFGHSLATLGELLGRPEPAGTAGPSRRVLTVHDPAFGDDARWQPLPGTRAEGEALRHAFANAHVVALAGDAAREAAVKAAVPAARIVHFGTHGIVEQDRSDLLAALVLSREEPDASEDGFLHLFEVYELGLDADLVVLSACETTLGRRVRGEGVFALSRGFLAAGARRVVASLWSVDDEATAELMRAFFAELGRGTAPSAALTAAKRSLRNDARFADPFYWAPFALSGLF